MEWITISHSSNDAPTSYSLTGEGDRVDQTKMAFLINLIVPVLAITFLFTLLNRFWLSPWQLTPESYKSKWITGSAILELASINLRTGLALAIVAALLFRWRQACVSWDELKAVRLFRSTICVSAGLLAWIYSTYDVNFCYGQSHFADRISLIVLFVGICFRPIFVFPFLFVLWPILGQFNVPIGGYSWAIAFLPARILLLAGCTILASSFVKKIPKQAFALVFFCLIAGHYFSSGIGKLKNGWIFNEQVFLLLPNTYANGWLGFLPVETIEWLTNVTAYFNTPMKIATLIAEVGCLFLLLSRSSLKFFFLMWPLFHLAIFLSSGIFFWPWIAIEFTVLLLLKNQETIDLNFNVATIAVSFILIVFSPFWALGVNLSWIESPVTYSYRVVAVSENGERFPMRPESLAPFNYQFCLGGFHYLPEKPTLPVTWGATNLQTFRRLKDVASAEHALELESRHGVGVFNKERKERFQEFLIKFITHHNQEESRHVFPQWISAPKFIWTFGKGAPLPRNEKVIRVEVEQIFSGFLNREYEVIRKKKVCEVVPKENS